ncbi:MAG TPA: hypothetical protein VK841_19120 [Polyangiaceae bacterium]|jgi:hypothetical protein|nr:hypothetical protein [Polyangiaceae bacterium]
MHKLGWVACSVLVLSACKGTALDLGETNVVEVAPLKVIVLAQTDTDAGVGGLLEEHMSTSLQPAPWQYQLFTLHPEAQQYLQQLNPYHLHIQALDKALPWQQTGGSLEDWDTSELDEMLPTTLESASEAMFQIMPPPILNNSNGPFFDDQQNFDDDSVETFAKYCGYLVQYYNRGGFTYPDDASTSVVNPNPGLPIHWWAIWGDFDTSGPTPTSRLNGEQYGEIYNRAVERMLAANGDAGEPLHFSAFEYGDPVNDPLPQDLHAFLMEVSEPVDVVAIHMFPVDTPSATDDEVFQKIPTFASLIAETVSTVANADSGIRNAKVWVTENNVNSQAPAGLPGFIVDTRGTDLFFAAFRPYTFSQFGKSGNGALFHWDFTAGNIDGGPNPDMDPQNAEMAYVTGTREISYWVDYWLTTLFPVSDTGPQLRILQLQTPVGGTNVDLAPVALSDKVEVLAVQNSGDGSVVLMLVDFASGAALEGGPGIVDGKGVARSFLVDVSGLGPFASGTIRIIDDPTADNSPLGPTTVVDVTNLSAIPVALPNYGVAFIRLLPVSTADAGH